MWAVSTSCQAVSPIRSRVAVESTMSVNSTVAETPLSRPFRSDAEGAGTRPLDRHPGRITDDPRVVTHRDLVDRLGGDVDLLAVVHHDVHRPRESRTHVMQLGRSPSRRSRACRSSIANPAGRQRPRPTADLSIRRTSARPCANVRTSSGVAKRRHRSRGTPPFWTAAPSRVTPRSPPPSASPGRRPRAARARVDPGGTPTIDVSAAVAGCSSRGTTAPRSPACSGAVSFPPSWMHARR